MNYSRRSALLVFKALLGLLFIFKVLPATLFAASVADLKISQVKYGDSSGASDEYIELYNPTTVQITLTWQTDIYLKRDSGGASISGITVTQTNTTIKGHGYFLIGTASTSGLPAGGLDATYSAVLASNDGVGIRSDNTASADPSTYFDVIGYGTTSGLKEGTTIGDPGAAGNVVERKPGGSSGSATDTNDNSQDFSIVAKNPRNSQSGAAPALQEPGNISDLTALAGSTEGSVQLYWTAPGDNGTSGNITSGNYWLRYSTAQISDFNNPPTPYSEIIVSTSITNPTKVHGKIITGLIPSGTYFFALVTYDGNFATATWSTSGFNTLNSTTGADFAPSTPIGLSALPDTLTSIKLSWSSNTEVDLNIYEIQFSSYSESIGFQSLGTFSTTTLSTVHSSLATNNTYFYVIRVKDNKGNYSAFSSTQSNFPRTVPPKAPGNLGVDIGGSSASQIKWVWNDLADNETFYMVLRDTTTLEAVSSSLSSNTTFYAESGLQPNTSYFRAVRVSNSAGSAFSNFVTSYTLANVPTGFTFVDVGFTSVAINWGGNNNPGITRYELSMSLDNFQTHFSTPITLLTGLTGTSTAQIGLVPGTNYYFRVRGYNGNDIPTSFANGNTTTKSDSTAPNPITDLTPSVWNAAVGAIRLTWSAPADAPGYGAVNGYLLRWNTASFGDSDFNNVRIVGQSLVPSSPKNAGERESMVITGLPSGAQVFFHIKSSDVSNNVSAIDTNAPSITVSPHILISEVQIKAPGAIAHEFVEIYNPGSSPVLLSNVQLIARTSIGGEALLVAWDESNPLVIKGLGYYLWINGAWSSPPVSSDLTSGFQSLILDNGGVALRLGSASDSPLIDSLTWGTANNGLAEKSNFATSPGSNQSLERKPGNTSPNAGNGTDTNDNSQDFALRTSADMQNSRFPREPDTFIPGSVSNLTALQGVYDGEINLAWTAPGNDGTEIPLLGNYIIKYSTIGVITAANFDSAAFSITFSTSGVLPISSTSPVVGKLITGLAPAATYYFAIKAQDHLNQTSIWNSSADVNTVNTLAHNWAQDSPPAVPSAILLDGRASGAIYLSWSASTATDINGYQVYYATWSQSSETESNKNYNGTGAAMGNSPIAVGNITEFGLTGLTDGQVYYIAVKSVDKNDNKSVYSSEISTSAIAGAPVSPSPLKATALSDTSIKWSWRGMPTAVNYFIYAATVTAPNNGVSASSTIAHPTSSYIQTGLSANTSSGFFVTAVNATGESGKSNVVSSYTLANAPSMSNLIFVGQSSATMQLNANSNPSNTVYEISQSQDNFVLDASTPVPFSVNTTTTIVTVTGLSEDVQYYFRVRAQNGNGISTDSSTAISTKTASSPVADHLVISEIQVAPGPTNQFLEIYNPTSADVSLDGWKIVRRSAAGGTVTTLITFVSSHIVKSKRFFLMGSLGYTGSVSADATGADDYSTTTDSSLQMINSAGTVIDAVGMGTITEAAAGVYETQTTVRPASGQSIERKSKLSSTASSMQSGSDAASGNSLDTNNNNSDFVTRTTPEPQNSSSVPEPRTDIVAPAAISDLTAQPSSSEEGTVTLKWTAPGDNGTLGTVSSYVLKVSTIGVIKSVNFDLSSAAVTHNVAWSNLVAGGNEESRSVTGLSPGATVYFALKAYDSSSNLSIWNSSSDVAAVNTEAFGLTLDLPPAPVSSLTTKSSNTAVNLSWSASTSTDVSFYRIYRDTFTSPTTEIVTTTGTSYYDFSLTNASSYFYRIKTVDTPPALTSVFSVESSTVPNLRPARSLFAVHSDTSVLLTWSASLEESATNFKRYNLRRGLSQGGPYTVLVGTFSAAISSYTDTTQRLSDGTTSTVLPGVTYYYVIQSSGSATIPIAVGNEIEGLPSAEGTALPDVSPPTISATEVALYNYTGGALAIKATVSDYRDSAKTKSGKIQRVRLYYTAVKSTPTLTVQDLTPVAAGENSYSGSAEISASTLSVAAALVSTITYFVEAFDGTNTSSSALNIVTVITPLEKLVGSDGGTLLMSFPDGGQLSLEIPAGALSGPVTITVTRLDDANPAPVAANEPNIDLSLLPGGKPLAGYEFGPDGTVFNVRPTIKMYYPTPTTVIDPNTLKVFLYEGRKWINQGGKANASNQVVFKPAHFSKYAIFPAKPSTQKTTDKKFITPNGDGRNDSAGWSEFIKMVTVYDMTGLEIWTGSIADFARDDSGDVIQWDGRDKSGKSVEGGSYIYRSEALNGEATHGVIIVIR